VSIPSCAASPVLGTGLPDPPEPTLADLFPQLNLANQQQHSLAVRVDFDDRAELLAAAPDVYYVTDHYLNYTSVLVRLSRVTPDVVRDLLRMAHKFVTSTGSRHSTSRSRRKTV